LFSASKDGTVVRHDLEAKTSEEFLKFQPKEKVPI